MLTQQDLKRYAPKMLEVVKKAKDLLAEGTHYLWGAQGNGHVAMKPDHYGPEKLTQFMRCGYVVIPDGTSYCAGRPKAPDVAQKMPWDTKNYHAQGGLYRWPRYFRDISTDGSPKLDEGVVWGEDCTNKMHFDCAGFVRYCFRQVLGPQIAIPDGMKTVAETVWPPKTGRAGSIAEFDVWPADLLYDKDFVHVGIATGHWLLTGLGVTDPGYSIHCYSANWGVLRTGIADTRWVAWKHVLRWQKWA